MSAPRTSTIVVWNLQTAERFATTFDVECHNNFAASGQPFLNLQVFSVYDPQSPTVFKQKSPLWFEGLITGQTYWFRSRVLISNGGPPSLWSALAQETAGDTVSPNVTYSPSGGLFLGSLVVKAGASGAPADLSHYEFYWAASGSQAPTTSTLPNAPSSTDGNIVLNTTIGDALDVWIRAVDMSGNRQEWILLGTFSETGVSTKLGGQGSVLPITAVGAPLRYSSQKPVGASIDASIRWFWADFPFYRPDGSFIVVISSSGALYIPPPAPSLSETGGGTDIARTLFVRIAYVREKMMYSIGAEASFSRSANSRLVVAAISAPTGGQTYDGWVPLFNATTNLERIVDDYNPHLGQAIPFGTGWTEHSDGSMFHVSGTFFSQDNSTYGVRVWKLPASITRYFYPSYARLSKMIEMMGGALLGGDPQQGIRAAGDNHYVMSSTIMAASTPASGGSGGGGGGGGDGGPCFWPKSLIRLRFRGWRRILALWQLLRYGGFVAPISWARSGDQVETRFGWTPVLRVLKHNYDGKLILLSDGGRVTPNHYFHVRGCGHGIETWARAEELFALTYGTVHRYKGPVYNLEVGGEWKEYKTKGGWVAHNPLK